MPKARNGWSCSNNAGVPLIHVYVTVMQPPYAQRRPLAAVCSPLKDLTSDSKIFIRRIWMVRYG